MEIDRIKEMIALLEGSNIDEIEVSTKDTKIRVARHANRVAATTSTQTNQQLATQPGAIENQPDGYSRAVVNTPSATSTTKTFKEENMVRSPMVGTFYIAPSPQAQPFVKVGDKVKAGDQLCIIEAMKMMNPIESTKSGTIVDISTDNGEVVQFDQLLFIIE